MMKVLANVISVTPVQPGFFLSHLGRNPRKLPLRAFLLLVLLFLFLGALTAMQVAVQRRILCWTLKYKPDQSRRSCLFSWKGNCFCRLLNIHSVWTPWGRVCAAAASSAGKLWLRYHVLLWHGAEWLGLSNTETGWSWLQHLPDWDQTSQQFHSDNWLLKQ